MKGNNKKSKLIEKHLKIFENYQSERADLRKKINDITHNQPEFFFNEIKNVNYSKLEVHCQSVLQKITLFRLPS